MFTGKTELSEQLHQKEIEICLNCPFSRCASGGYSCTHLTRELRIYKKEIKESLKNEEKNSATNSTQKSIRKSC